MFDGKDQPGSPSQNALNADPTKQNQGSYSQQQLAPVPAAKAPPATPGQQVGAMSGNGASTGTAAGTGQQQTQPVKDDTTPQMSDNLGDNADPQRSIDEMQQELMRQLLGGAGNVDTSAGDALLHQQFHDQQQKQLVDQRARMGRGGWGSSGALGALEGDTMRQSAQAESQARLDFDNKQKQQAIENALSSVGADVSLRGATTAEEQAQRQDAMMKMVLDMFGGDQGTGSEGQDGGFQEIDADTNHDGKVDPMEAAMHKAIEHARGTRNADLINQNKASHDHSGGPDPRDARAEYAEVMKRGFGQGGSGDPGSPLKADQGDKSSLEAQGWTFTDSGQTGDYGLPIYTDQNGKQWLFYGEKGWW